MSSTNVVNMIIHKDKSYPGCDSDSPECKTCKILYEIYGCGCYDMTCPDFKATGSCKTCHPTDLYEPIEERPEPTTMPQIEVKEYEKLSCGKPRCTETFQLPKCQRKKPCQKSIKIFSCAHLVVSQHGSWESCRECHPKNDEDFPMTRPDVVIYDKTDRPKYNYSGKEVAHVSVCRGYYEHEDRRAERKILQEDRERRAQEEIRQPKTTSHARRYSSTSRGFMHYATGTTKPTPPPVIPQENTRRHKHWQQEEDRAHFDTADEIVVFEEDDRRTTKSHRKRDSSRKSTSKSTSTPSTKLTSGKEDQPSSSSRKSESEKREPRTPREERNAPRQRVKEESQRQPVYDDEEVLRRHYRYV
ncbi:hypothetical protein NHQ30_004894 [Ciborinia camelliae]|nr:hypothetical protein NHQ30_004894 [Ciborinia camelliae]